MHGDDLVPLRVLHVCERLVSEYTSVIDNAVDGTERIDGGLDDRIAIFSRSLVSDCAATHLLNLTDHIVGVHEVVHYNVGANLCEGQAVCASDPRIINAVLANW